MVYATEEFYEDEYLLGRKPQLPNTEFKFWEHKARIFVDQFTFDRISQEDIDGPSGDKIKRCVCELAEFLYLNEGSENKKSEGIPGRSVSYIQGIEYDICQRYLMMTGLMYRGSK